MSWRIIQRGNRTFAVWSGLACLAAIWRAWHQPWWGLDVPWGLALGYQGWLLWRQGPPVVPATHWVEWVVPWLSDGLVPAAFLVLGNRVFATPDAAAWALPCFVLGNLGPTALLWAGTLALAPSFAIVVEGRRWIRTGIYRWWPHPLYTAYLLSGWWAAATIDRTYAYAAFMGIATLGLGWRAWLETRKGRRLLSCGDRPNAAPPTRFPCTE